MSAKKGQEATYGGRILIQRLETIGEVHEDAYGEVRMVVAAFQVAGEYLDGQAGKGESDQVEFRYRGVRFTAAVEVGNGEE